MLIGHAKVRVKQRYGRVHRLCRFSTNPLKAQLLKPTYTQRFRIKVATSPPPRTDSGAASPAPLALPLNDTADIDTILDAIKEAVSDSLVHASYVSPHEGTTTNAPQPIVCREVGPTAVSSRSSRGNSDQQISDSGSGTGPCETTDGRALGPRKKSSGGSPDAKASEKQESVGR